MPKLHINLNSIRHNIKYIKNYCEDKKIELVAVIKGFEQTFPIINLFNEEMITSLGVSDLSTAKHLNNDSNIDISLLSIPTPQDAVEVVQYCKCSLNSEIETIQALAVAAEKVNKLHEIILMVDIGDLREGVMPEDVIKTVHIILSLNSKHLKLIGIGANLVCCSGVLPSVENLSLLQFLATQIEIILKYPLKTISIGGSVMLDWMENNSLPSDINQLRVGEAFLLGIIPGINKKHQHLKQDAFTFAGEIVEVKSKPSMPIGKIGKDAFGNDSVLKNKGIQKRAILNFGTVHTIPQSMIPVQNKIKLINANSNYSIYDVTDFEDELKPGDSISFNLTYPSLVQSLLSPYTKQIVIQ